MQSRRTFVKNSALLSAGVLLYPKWKMNDAHYNKIGLQLYTVRDAMGKDPKGTIAKVAQTGYKEVEGATYTGSEKFYGMSAPEFLQVLNENGLKMVSGHYMLGGLTKTDHSPKGSMQNDWEKAVEDAAAVGQKYMVCAFLMPDERKDYKRVAEILNKAGETCKKSGIQLCYHNHNFEFPEVDGKIPYEILLTNADADLVKMEMDLYWVTKAGKDPIKLFKEHPGRFVLWHVKGMDNTPEHSFTEVGSGIIDYKKIFEHAKEAGMKHFFVEEDHCPGGDPFASIAKSYNYLKKMLA